MKNRMVNGLLALLVLGAVAALVAFFVMRGNDPAKDQVAPDVEPIVYMSTSGIVSNIERRLEPKIGTGLTAMCPEEVDESVGTTFDCDVVIAGTERTVAVATVEINGEGGQFRWTSEPFSEPSATPTAP